MEKVTRRKFIASSISFAAGSYVLCGQESEVGLLSQLNGLLAEANCDPMSENGALLAIASDFHMFLGTEFPHLRTEKWDDELIGELNLLHPLITNLVIAGDLITYRSMAPGHPPYGIHEQWAIQEYALAQNEVQRFRMPLWMVPGNHDTYAYETNAEMFVEKMGVPAYQKVELAGLPIFLLNTGNAGMLNAEQEVWLRDEALKIDPDQEVLIIQHIPTFSTVYTQAGSKRVIAEAFAGRSATVYIASGHNHRFGESVSEYEGTKFVQMLTTTANRVVFNDQKNPGYLLIGIQDGRIRMRVQRSLTVDRFWSRPDISNLPVNPVRFPFDDVKDCMEFFEEGFYNREGILEFSGVHVGCYVAFCKRVTIKVEPHNYYGKIRKIIISGLITAPNRPACWISSNAEEGAWSELVFPSAKGSGLYEVGIPDLYANMTSFYVKLDTGLTVSTHGFSFSGWAIASDAESLSGYERWLLQVYGSLRISEENKPDAIASGGMYKNILTYAFNLPTTDGGGEGALPRITSVESTQGGGAAVVRYTRIKDSDSAGLIYRLQSSHDMKEWNDIDSGIYTEVVVEQGDDYERVDVELPLLEKGMSSFYQIVVEHVGLITN